MDINDIKNKISCMVSRNGKIPGDLKNISSDANELIDYTIDCMKSTAWDPDDIRNFESMSFWATYPAILFMCYEVIENNG